MAAIAAVMKMRCVGLQPAVAGQPETVELVEDVTNSTTNSNLHVMPIASAIPMARMRKITIDKAAAQGKFVKDRSYRVEFTLLADGGYADGA